MIASLLAVLFQASALTMAAMPLDQVSDFGARVPFAEVEAENATTNGEIIVASRAAGSIVAEASGRRAVRLTGPNDFIEITLARAADAYTVRYAIPDSEDGAGRDARLSLSVGEKEVGHLALTSRYSWHYGIYPFTNRPQDGLPRHIYDHARVRLAKRLPAGTRLRLQAPQASETNWVIVDLIDYESAPFAERKAAHALSVVAFGADPTGQRSSVRAFEEAITQARRQRRALWIPRGTFQIDRHLDVGGVEMVGAGVWWTTLRGDGIGLVAGARQRLTLRGFSLIGAVAERNDQAALAAIGGTFGANSVVEDLWIQHTKVGIWLDGPAQGLVFRRLRIFDQTADGMNLAGSVRNAVIEDVFVRNSGDDGVALWSRGGADRNIVISRVTVIAPTLANGIALYGGRDIDVRDSLVADSAQEGGGYHLGARFDAAPFSGKITLRRNVAVRAGSIDRAQKLRIGALWFYALDQPINADIEIDRMRIIDSTFDAVQVLGRSIGELRVDDLVVEGAGGAALRIQAPGIANFSRIRLRDVNAPGVRACAGGFQLRIAGDPAWSYPRACRD